MTKPDYLHRLERLIEISRKLSTGSDLEPFLQLIAETAPEMVDCQDGSILTYDEENKALRFIAGPWFEMDIMRSFRVPLETSIAGWVFTNSQPVVVQDADQDPRVFRAVDQALNFETGSILAVPMVFKNQTIGVIEAVNKNSKSSFTDEDVTTLEVLAALAAVAWQNTRLLEKSQEAYQQIVELDRMKTDFIAITSHEIRTPLGLILGHAAFLQDIAGSDEASSVEIILKNAMRLKDIIEEFANIDNVKSGMARLRTRPVDIQALIRDVVDTFQESARKKDITLRTDTNRAAITLSLDEKKISAALSNLVDNALIFTNPGGHVLVRAETAAGFLRVYVVDDGIGIPAKDLTNVFQRFFQVESHLTRSHGGMGLGLSITRDMVEMHGGRIWVESVEGRGSRFTFLLPLEQVKTAPL
jgi:signal transduction histidine kinase